jgi:tetratricopeptide (TPR) repeat protein
MEWYRKKSWTETDEEHFFAKLKRARKDNRAQYLRIQAVELIQTNKPQLLEVAESLLTQMLTEYPDEDFSIASALNSLGDIYQKQQKLEKAIEFYKKSVDFEKKYPNVKTQSYLDYSELILRTNKIDKFDYTKRIILERFNDVFLPIEKYRASSILSVIYYYENQVELADKYANIAEQNAKKETSGLRYHKHFGVVNERKKWLDDLVNRK